MLGFFAWGSPFCLFSSIVILSLANRLRSVRSPGSREIFTVFAMPATFRSSWLPRPGSSPLIPSMQRPPARSEEHTSELQSQSNLRFPLFFFNDTAPTEISTLSLHDALPIYAGHFSVFLVTPAGIIATDPINAEAAR